MAKYALTVATIWGYFFDLKNGQEEWFIGRLIVVPLIAVLVHRLFFRSSQVLFPILEHNLRRANIISKTDCPF